MVVSRLERTFFDVVCVLAGPRAKSKLISEEESERVNNKLTLLVLTTPPTQNIATKDIRVLSRS